MNNNLITKTRATTTAFGAAMTCIIFTVGCAPIPEEVDGTDPFAPVNCNDLGAGALIIDVAPYSPFVTGDPVYADAPFGVRWFAHFTRGSNMNYFGFTGEYVASITIFQGDTEVYYEEIDATPLNVASGDYDGTIVEAGLPAGDYLIRVVLDVNGTVEQCNDLIFVLNNVSTTELTVESEPIDDVAQEPDDEDDDEGEVGQLQSREPIRR